MGGSRGGIVGPNPPGKFKSSTGSFKQLDPQEKVGPTLENV